MEDLLPFYLAIGVSYERFMDGSPTELKPFLQAQKMRQNMQDERMWIMGNYVREAVGVAIENCFAKHPKAKYCAEPITQKIKKQKQKNRMTRKERKNGQEQLMMKLKLMQSNFESNHQK